MKEEILTKGGITVIPNEQELDFAKKLKMPNIYKSPIAIRNRTVFEKDLPLFVGATVQEREGFESIINANPKYRFLYHLQTKEGLSLSVAHLNTIDEIQDLPNSPYFVIYQKHPDISLAEFISRLDSVEKRFSHKILIPALDPSEKDLVTLKQKVVEIAKRNYKTVAILYRNPQKYYDGWQIIQANLQTEEIEMIALGVQRRWINLKNGKKVSTLGGPLLFGCRGVSHYRPWSGGASPQVLLDDNIFYVEPRLAGKCLMDYNGIDRIKLFGRCKKSQQYEFCRVDSIIQAQELFSTIIPIKTKTELTVAGVKINGIDQLAEHFGML